MTTLLCWCGVDSRGPTSLYVATDSRFSWPEGQTWDAGRKIVVLPGQYGMLALAGDVTLVQSLLLRLGTEKVTDELIAHQVVQLSDGYQSAALRATAVVFARRAGMSMDSSFQVTAHEFRADSWVLVEHSIPVKHSKIVCAYGSGAGNAKAEVGLWTKDDSGNTSRSMFSGFCDALRKGKDPKTGGPPQLVGLYRSGPAMEFGIVWESRLFLAGLTPSPKSDVAAFEWRNDLLERCDPTTGQRLLDAQHHARPYGLR